MKKIFYIAQKELEGFFKSPIAYLVLIVSVSIFNIFFFMIIDNGQEAVLRDVFKLMEFMFVFFIPLLTMKIFSEEKLTGTMEFLMTTPTKNCQIILGKYFSLMIMFFLMIASVIVYYGILEFYSSPDLGSELLGIFGIFLEGAFFVAVGLFTSAMTKSHIIAAISSYLVLFLLYFAVSFKPYFEGPMQVLLDNVSLLKHSENMFSGLLVFSDVVYFTSGIVLFLVLSALTLNKRFET